MGRFQRGRDCSCHRRLSPAAAIFDNWQRPFVTSPRDDQDWSWEGSMHEQCDQSLNIPAGVRPEHSECIVSPDLAQCSSTSSIYLVIMGCAGRRLLFLCQLKSAVLYVC